MSTGETLAARSLQKEKRGSVIHYAPGQHEFKIQEIAEEDGGGRGATLSYVDQMGHVVVIVFVEEAPGVWTPMVMARAGQETRSVWAGVPDSFELSDKMRAAIRQAEEER